MMRAAWSRRNRPLRQLVPLRSGADGVIPAAAIAAVAITTTAVATAVTTAVTAAPPRLAHAGGPSPPKCVVVIPGSALVRHIAPRLARNPNVAVARSHHPITRSIGVPTGVGSLIRRPDSPLIRHFIPGAAAVQIAPCRVVGLRQVLIDGSRSSLRRGQSLIAVRIPRIPRIGLNRLRHAGVSRIAAIDRDTLPAMEIHSQARTFKVRIAGEYRHVGRSLIQLEPNHRKSASRQHSGAELNAHRAALAPALQFEVTHAAVQYQFRISIRTKHGNRKRAVRRNSRHAAVVKLHLCSTVIPGRQLGAFKQGRIRDRVVGQHLPALRHLHLAVDGAQPRGTARLSARVAFIGVQNHR